MSRLASPTTWWPRARPCWCPGRGPRWGSWARPVPGIRAVRGPSTTPTAARAASISRWAAISTPRPGQRHGGRAALRQRCGAGRGGGSAGQREQTAYVFCAAVAITPAKTVLAVTLPGKGSAPASGMHIFAVAIGSFAPGTLPRLGLTHSAQDTGTHTGSAEEDLGLVVTLGRHHLELAGRLGQRAPGRCRCRAAPPSRRTPPRAPLDRVHAEPGRQHPVVRRRRAAPLDVAEHRAAGLLAGALLDLIGQPLPDAAQPDVTERVQLLGWRRRSSLTGRAPSATTTIGAYWSANRCSTLAQTLSMSNGRSGIRITLAPPASPACSAIQPAWRPMTSTISTRWWVSAVVCSRSIASIAIFTAVSKPKV